MMDIFFQDSDAIPLPPDEVRIRQVNAEPYPDGRRVRIAIETDPFQKPPSLDVFVHDANGVLLAQVDVIESMTRELSFTLHLRYDEPHPPYTVTAVLYHTHPISQESIQLPERLVTDQKQALFNFS